MTNPTERKLTQEQLDRYNAFEAMLDMMDPDDSYTKDELVATIDQIVEMAVEDREVEMIRTIRADEVMPGMLYWSQGHGRVRIAGMGFDREIPGDWDVQVQA